MNAVLLAVILMLVLAVCRVHVVIALFIGALVGGLVGGLGLDGTMLSFQEGLTGGAQIALSYALLGAFAMAVAHTGLPDALARWMIARLDATSPDSSSRTHRVTKWALIGAILLMAIMSQNLIPVHIAFIPLLIPPLLTVFNRLHLDRRAISTTLTFGLVTTYMFIPVGFGNIFLNDILLGNIRKAGMSTDGIKIMHAMGIPALGMMSGLLIALFCHLEASVRVVARPDGLEVRNLMRTRTFEWPEVLGISFPMGDPWAHLDLADGRTHPLHAIQRYDGERAISAAHRLLHLVQERGEARGESDAQRG